MDKPLRIEYVHTSTPAEFFEQGWGLEQDMDISSAAKALQRAQQRYRLAEEQEEDMWVRIKARELVGVQETMQVLRRQIHSLNRVVGQLQKQQLQTIGFVRIQTRDVTSAEAETIVEEYLEKHGHAYPSDISNELGISLEATIEALNRLETEGSVKKRE